MTHFNFNEQGCNGEVTYDAETREYTVTGVIQDTVKDGHIAYFAAAPTDRRSSWTGSGLPYANAAQAFYNTPNSGEIELGMFNKFSIKVKQPGSYYVALGSAVIPPTLFIMYSNGSEDRTISIKLSNSIPFRMLTYPNGQGSAARSSASFYDGDYSLPIRTQEKILLDSAYPGEHSNMPGDFWGLRPRR